MESSSPLSFSWVGSAAFTVPSGSINTDSPVSVSTSSTPDPSLSFGVGFVVESSLARDGANVFDSSKEGTFVLVDSSGDGAGLISSFATEEGAGVDLPKMLPSGVSTGAGVSASSATTDDGT